MKKEQVEFLKLLFNEGESVCVTSGKYGAHSIAQNEIGPSIQLKTPPKLDAPGKEFTISEDDIQLIAINPIDGWKRDENVTSYRNFMLEFDDGPLKEQMDYVESTGLPYSACVYSGNKSMHYAVCLTQPCNESIWRFTMEWMLNILTKADQQNKSPSRGIRFPGNVRKNGKKNLQKLVKINKRVTQEELNNWLSKHRDKMPKIRTQKPQDYGNIVTEADLPPFVIETLQRLESGTQLDRNVTWFKLAAYLSRKGMPRHSVESLFEKFFTEEPDFRHNELLSCIKSAYKDKL